jgi:acyl carrier protein
MDFKAEIKAIIVAVTGLDADEITGDEKFSDEFGIESVSVLNVITKIEEKFGIEIPEERYAEMSTLNNVVRVVQSAKAG